MTLLQRLHNFLSKPAVPQAVTDLYAACVEQARQPAFYQDLAVPDTVDGRFDLLLLHVFIVMMRLSNETQLKQQLFDLMFADMDRNLREMGVGDMSISKKIKPMISAFYGRGQAYHGALAGNDDDLAAALSRNLYGSRPVGADILNKMTTYVRATVASLEEQKDENIVAGQIMFVRPIR
jgi:cytochrome b pre-mRNA-processing protein 3